MLVEGRRLRLRKMFRSETIPTTDTCFIRGGGAIWQQLHAEREAVCAALLNRGVPVEEATASIHDLEPADESSREVERRRMELLQMRLCSLDDALDRLISGSYGLCCECGKQIEPKRLNHDPAVSYCVKCQTRMENEQASDDMSM
jgi:DnaK suppressor protein